MNATPKRFIFLLAIAPGIALDPCSRRDSTSPVHGSYLLHNPQGCGECRFCMEQNICPCSRDVAHVLQQSGLCRTYKGYCVYRRGSHQSVGRLWLVVGLSLSGDKNKFTGQTLRSMLGRFGLTLPPGIDPKSKI